MNYQKIICVFILILLFSGCVGEVETNLNSSSVSGDKNYLFDTNNLMRIVSTDKEYDEFIQLYPNFRPELKSYFSLTKNNYPKLKESWKNDSEMNVYIEIIDEIELTESTYFVEFISLDNNKYDLISILDIDKNVSLKLISKVKMNFGETI